MCVCMCGRRGTCLCLCVGEEARVCVCMGIEAHVCVYVGEKRPYLHQVFALLHIECLSPACGVTGTSYQSGLKQHIYQPPSPQLRILLGDKWP
jgi:hypothetical protein